MILVLFFLSLAMFVASSPESPNPDLFPPDFQPVDEDRSYLDLFPDKDIYERIPNSLCLKIPLCLMFKPLPLRRLTS